MTKLHIVREQAREKKKPEPEKKTKSLDTPLTDKILTGYGLAVAAAFFSFWVYTNVKHSMEVRYGNEYEVPEKRETPKNEKVVELKNIIESAGIKAYTSYDAIEKGNDMTEKGLDLMIEFSSVLKDMGMDGDNIINALIQVEDPWPKAKFKLEKDPTKEELLELKKIIGDIAYNQSHLYIYQKLEPGNYHRDYVFGCDYDKSEKTLYITARF